MPKIIVRKQSIDIDYDDEEDSDKEIDQIKVSKLKRQTTQKISKMLSNNIGDKFKMDRTFSMDLFDND